ncbi:MAG: hypothetical protein R3190_14805, partial [Thermoanaerobaculia bacterium]|nr:hypothetical protein [Thermoanaerobaculia bacterium]
DVEAGDGLEYQRVFIALSQQLVELAEQALPGVQVERRGMRGNARGFEVDLEFESQPAEDR